MASQKNKKQKDGSIVCINESLSDDELRSVLWKLESNRDKQTFGLVCKRWLHLQSTETKTLEVRAAKIAPDMLEVRAPLMLRKLAARFTNVVKLHLSHRRVTDSDLGVVADCFKCLRFLSLWLGSGITDAGMVEIGRGLPSLQYLNVSYSSGLTDKGFSAVAEGCCNLRSLHLFGCSDVTDKVFQALSKNCHNLKELGMKGCANITDSGLESLVRGCQRIEWLDISFCSNITVVGIGVLLDKCHSLEYLNVSSCPNVMKAGCDMAGLQFPTCCRVNFGGTSILVLDYVRPLESESEFEFDFDSDSDSDSDLDTIDMP